MTKLLLAISQSTHYDTPIVHTVRTEQEILDALHSPVLYRAFILDGEAIGLYNRDAGRDIFMNPLYPIFRAAHKKNVPVHYFRANGFDQIDFVSHPNITVIDKEHQGRVLEQLLQN